MFWATEMCDAQPLARERHFADITRADKIGNPEDRAVTLQLRCCNVRQALAVDVKIRPEEKPANNIEIAGKPAGLKLPNHVLGFRRG